MKHMNPQLSRQLQVDAISVAFEEQLRTGHKPSIEAIIEEHREPLRSDLLRDLLHVELEYRSAQGEQWDVAEKYYDVFLSESRKLGSQPFIYRAYRRQATTFQRQGKYRQAVTQLHRAENSKAFEDQSFLFQQYFYDEIRRVHQELGGTQGHRMLSLRS